MQLYSAEHYEIMESFEREYWQVRLDHEEKSMWPLGNVYQSGNTNDMFLAYRKGYAHAKSVYSS